MKKLILVSILALPAAAAFLSGEGDFPGLTGPYLGQKPPGMTPLVFAAGIISTDASEFSVSFPPAALRALKLDFEAGTGEPLGIGVIAVIQTFGDRINFHPHLHFPVTAGGLGAAGVFHEIARIDDARLSELFAREVLVMLVAKCTRSIL